MGVQRRCSRIAPESSKTKRAREKLQKQWDEEKLLITEAALADTVDKIHKWIASHAVNRVHVPKKDIRLFDQNQNAASLSRKIQLFAKKLHQGFVDVDFPGQCGMGMQGEEAHLQQTECLPR